MLEIAGLDGPLRRRHRAPRRGVGGADGAVCGLIGPNGAGKTTLFNCVSRLVEPAAGSIRFDGTELLDASARTRSPRSASPARSSTSRWSRR